MKGYAIVIQGKTGTTETMIGVEIGIRRETGDVTVIGSVTAIVIGIADMIMTGIGNVTETANGIAHVREIETMTVTILNLIVAVPVRGIMILSQNMNRSDPPTERGSMMTLSLSKMGSGMGMQRMMDMAMGALSLKRSVSVMIIMSISNPILTMILTSMKEWNPKTIRNDLFVMIQGHEKGRRVGTGNVSISELELAIG